MLPDNVNPCNVILAQGQLCDNHFDLNNKKKMINFIAEVDLRVVAVILIWSFEVQRN